jgi:hypothetical protein
LDTNDPPILEIVNRLSTHDVLSTLTIPPIVEWPVTGAEEPEVRLVPAQDRRRQVDSR